MGNKETHQEICSVCGTKFETQIHISPEFKGDSFCSTECYDHAVSQSGKDDSNNQYCSEKSPLKDCFLALESGKRKDIDTLFLAASNGMMDISRAMDLADFFLSKEEITSTITRGINSVNHHMTKKDVQLMASLLSCLME